MFQRKDTPLFQYLVKKVFNLSEFEDAWNLYGFENKAPEIDFNGKAVFFIGVYESGSCPYKIKDIKQNNDNKTMIVSLMKPEGAYTSDATPRTFVIQINKELSKDIKAL